MAKYEADFVALWRAQAGTGNPAGPLYAGGEFAVADMISEATPITERCGTICTGSLDKQCC